MNHVGLQKSPNATSNHSPDGSMPLRLTEPCHPSTLQPSRRAQSAAQHRPDAYSSNRRSHSLANLEARLTTASWFSRNPKHERRWLASHDYLQPLPSYPLRAQSGRSGCFARVGSRVAPGAHGNLILTVAQNTQNNTQYLRTRGDITRIAHRAAHNPESFFRTQFDS